MAVSMLAGVVEYSSSSEDESPPEVDVRSTDGKSELASSDLKRNISDLCHENKQDESDHHENAVTGSKRVKIDSSQEPSLPLPSAIKDLFSSDDSKRKNKTADHDGRVRTFEHVEGNWATFVYIPVNPDTRLLELFESLMTCLRPHKFQRMPDFHVTLSRTVVIRHHWIESLMESLRENLSTCESSICDILHPKLYTNDEKTRTFACLEVQGEGTNLPSYVGAVDKCFDEFKLQHYYENPSFHISFAWCLGDVTAKISEKAVKNMKCRVCECFSTHPDLSVLQISTVHCKTGKKVFQFQLQDEDT